VRERFTRARGRDKVFSLSISMSPLLAMRCAEHSLLLILAMAAKHLRSSALEKMISRAPTICRRADDVERKQEKYLQILSPDVNRIVRSFDSH
jgi:alpha/beta superfamily hydrolase